MINSINSFFGEYRWLSNFWRVHVNLDGFAYPSVEHAYQAAKTLDPIVRERIRTAATPGRAKRGGNNVKLRPHWEQIKIGIMRELLYQKFARYSYLRKQLIDTGDLLLVEGNTWGDTFWGVCDGKGENQLGILLMEVRNKIRGF